MQGVVVRWFRVFYLIGVSNMLTDHELLAAVQSSSAIDDPAVRELARRFSEDVAAMDADEAAWLKRPRRAAVSRSRTPPRRYGYIPAEKQ
jgi:hypothetical protein